MYRFSNSSRLLRNYFAKIVNRKKRFRHRFEHEKPRKTVCTESLLFWMSVTTLLVIVLTFLAKSLDHHDPFLSMSKTHDSSPVVIAPILVSIASFAGQKVSCFGAIDTAIKYAYNPERISFIIVNINTTSSTKQSCLKSNAAIDSFLLEELDDTVHELFVSEPGISHGRFRVTEYLKTNGMINDFDYVLEIHAHSIFTYYWDVELLNEYNTAMHLNGQSSKTILSNHPSSTTEMSQREFDHNHGKTMNILCGTKVVDPQLNKGFVRYSVSWEIEPPNCHVFDEQYPYRNRGTVPNHIQSRLEISFQIRKQKLPFDMVCEPIQVPFFSHLFSFGSVQRLVDVPYDPYLTQVNENDGLSFMYSTRLHTHAYKVYAPAQDILFHFYEQAKQKRVLQKKYRKDTDTRASAVAIEKDIERIKQLMTLTANKNAPETEKYGLGSEGSVENFLTLVHVDLNGANAVAGGDKLCYEIRNGEWNSMHQ